ncbi:low specificity L-threonine aldolase [Rapidithrix thailandica]|uniref:Low specificity L-threonine aldolase n=1 Tax=Rapidithrix thailandica TaxID=413964 RepID=A0AAW9RWX4_9BACT
MNKQPSYFASDNYATVHPKVMKALQEANQGHAGAYGNDTYTTQAKKKFKELFGEQAEADFVYNGTGANVTGLATLLKSFEAVVCSEVAHINVDECGAPEKFTGSKLIGLPSQDGKIKIEQIQPLLHSVGFEHHAQARVISITQVTEFGTVYRPEEIKIITDFAHSHGMYVHMDGARLANAAASLGCSFKAFTTDVGVDLLSFGGTKNGLMFGEAVVFLNPELGKNYKYVRKQGMQLASKMRYISAQFLAYLEEDVWLKNARHANRLASLLEKEVRDAGVEITQKVEANALFVKLPKAIAEALQKDFFFYPWDEEEGVYRWMTSFDSTEEDVEQFITRIKQLLG